MRASSARIQTAFRLDQDLLERLRRQARLENRTLNSYVEIILLKAVQPELPQVEEGYQLSAETRKMCGFIPPITKEQLEKDDRLAYLLGK